MSLNSVELFAGAGGLGLGLHQAGFKTLAAVENNKYACATLRSNKLLGENCIIHQENIRNHDYSKYSKIDLVSGGPPCQPFSFGGKHSAQNDDRDMFPEAVRAIRELKPKAFIFENVKGLLRKSFTSYFEYVLLQLQYPNIAKNSNEVWEKHLSRLEKHHTGKTNDDVSYNVVFRLINSANYGVPQKRERVIIVGFRKGLDIHWSFPKSTHTEDSLLWEQLVTKEYWEKYNIPEPEYVGTSKALRKRSKLLESYSEEQKIRNKPWKTTRDVIHDLPAPYINEENTEFTNHMFRPGARSYPGHTGSYIDSPSKTLKAGVHGVPGGENMVRYEDNSVRYFTIRESARIQTFPDEYHLSGSWSESMRQLGNAVPVEVARVIGESVLNSIK